MQWPQSVSILLLSSTMAGCQLAGGGGGGGRHAGPPDISSISPTTAAQNSGSFTLTINGFSFLSDSTVNFGGNNLVPTSLTPNILTVTVPNSDIQTVGQVSVTVQDRNGSSNAFTFTVTSAGAACALSGGQYAFLVRGSNANGAAAMVGSVTIGGDGSVTTGSLDFKDHSTLLVNQAITGGPGSCKNGLVANTGTLSFTAAGVSRTLNFALSTTLGAGFGRVEESDSSIKGSGEIYFQVNPASPSFGSYAFGMEGADATGNRYVVVGALCSNNSLSVTYLQADLDDNNNNAAAQSFTGTPAYSAPDANGRSTTNGAITFANGASLNLTFYATGAGGPLLAIESSTIGTSVQVLSGFISGLQGSNCLPTTAGSFSNASLKTSVFHTQGEQSGAVTASAGLMSNISPTGGTNGQATASLTADFNNAGSYSSLTAASATYSISAGGRGVINCTNAQGQPAQVVFYMDGASAGGVSGISYLVGQSADIPFGLVVAQGNVTPGGTYALGTNFIPAGTTPLVATEVAVDNTNKTFTDQSSGGSSSTGPYTLDATTGRGSVTLNNATTFGDTSIVFYVVGPTTIWGPTNTIWEMPTTTKAPLVGLLTP